MYGQMPDSLKFTRKHERTLKNLVITESQPGSVLQDFNALLDHLREGEHVLTASKQLPLRLVTEINQRMKQPLQIGLQRAAQKSYPRVHGLYLLVRASGLTSIRVSGKKQVLVVDEDVYTQWQGLNPTEQYGTLLETWFLRGYEEILGERAGGSWDIPNNFRHILWFFARSDSQGKVQIAGNRIHEEGLKYYPGWHNLGLLDLFGFITIEDAPPIAGQGWNIQRITITPLGAAFLSLLINRMLTEEANLPDEESEIETLHPFQRLLQPCLPEWKKNLVMPKTPLREGTHIFKVSLGPVWRRIAINGKQPLITLADAILASVEFDNDHLHEFSYTNRFGITERVSHPYLDEAELVSSEVLVGEAPISIGGRMTFLFDFGDNWEFDVLLETVEPKRIRQRYKILETHGEAPEQYPDWDDWDESETAE